MSWTMLFFIRKNCRVYIGCGDIKVETIHINIYPYKHIQNWPFLKRPKGLICSWLCRNWPFRYQCNQALPQPISDPIFLFSLTYGRFFLIFQWGTIHCYNTIRVEFKKSMLMKYNCTGLSTNLQSFPCN